MARNFKHRKLAVPANDKLIYNVLRLMRGMKSTDVAHRAGLAPSTISKLRTRRTRYPRLATAAAIASACGHVLAFVPVKETTTTKATRRWDGAEARP